MGQSVVPGRSVSLVRFFSSVKRKYWEVLFSELLWNSVLHAWPDLAPYFLGLAEDRIPSRKELVLATKWLTESLGGLRRLTPDWTSSRTDLQSPRAGLGREGATAQATTWQWLENREAALATQYTLTKWMPGTLPTELLFEFKYHVGASDW